MKPDPRMFGPAEMSGSSAPLQQVSSVYRYKVGGLHVTALNDGHNPVELKEGFIPGVSVDEMNRQMEAEFLPRDSINIPFTPILIETGGDLALIDTGFGDSGQTSTGFLRQNMKAAGLAPGDITRIIVSHFHRDHINGLLAEDGSRNFPNAKLFVPDIEWAYWRDPANQESAPAAARANFENVERVMAPFANEVQEYRWNDEILPGIKALAAPGHTPGHTAFTLASGSERLIFMSDTCNHPALFVRNPDWSPAFDMDPETARATRRRILGMIADEGLPCAGYHMPFPALGRIGREGARFRFHPAQWLGFVV